MTHAAQLAEFVFRASYEDLSQAARGPLALKITLRGGRLCEIFGSRLTKPRGEV